jgi:radical SAM-linked protein
MRLIERAARRAELPLALTQGFNSHPRMSFVSALPVGSSSLSEYADIILSRPLKPEEFLNRLNKKLPGEVQILEAAEVPMDAPSLTSTINRTALYAKEGGKFADKTDSYRC